MNKLKLLLHHINLDTQYQSITKIPKNKIGLVFNIEKHNPLGSINSYYKQRLETVLQLFKANKIEFILIDNNDFKSDLINRGVSENKVYLDHSSFKNIDDLIKVKELFGLNSITIIS